MLYFIVAFLLSLILTFLVRAVAFRFEVVDRPDGGRHLHEKSTPLLGGIAVFISFWAVISYLVIYHPIQGIDIIASTLGLAFFSSLIILLIGVADDIRPFAAKLRLPMVAIAIFISAINGPWLTKLTNPFGGYIEIGKLAAVVVVFFWLIGTTYTVKILDGLDGLATGLVAIGAFVIVLLTSITNFFQPNVSLVALIFLGTCLGFLVFNFYPAKIFLGESGSMFLGFMIGVLAIIGGGKLATALLVMAIPVFDLIRVIYIRVRRGQPIFTGDREHLHFRLVDAGFSQRQAVGLLYFMAILFGLSTLFLQSLQKFYALLFLVILMVIISHLIGKKKYN
jgi:UDP-GlcNAc:undecaprenyl-phosphate GlcNAc-1-phosphate transferase